MSEQLYLRRCRKHRLNLEEAGDELICPAPPSGHVCEDFVVVDRKTGVMVNEVPVDEAAAPRARPVGSADVTRMLGRDVPKKESKRMSNDQTKPKRRSPGVLMPHGTHQRYFQEVRLKQEPCEPCRKAAAEYGKARKAARMATGGAQTEGRATKPAKMRKPKAVQRKPTKILRPARRFENDMSGVVKTADLETPSLSAMANTIEFLRRDLANREAAFAAAVAQVLPNYKLLPTVDVEVVEAITTTKRDRAA